MIYLKLVPVERLRVTASFWTIVRSIREVLLGKAEGCAYKGLHLKSCSPDACSKKSEALSSEQGYLYSTGDKKTFPAIPVKKSFPPRVQTGDTKNIQMFKNNKNSVTYLVLNFLFPRVPPS